MGNKGGLLTSVKTMRPFPGFWKIYNRLPWIIRFVRDPPIFSILTRGQTERQTAIRVQESKSMVSDSLCSRASELNSLSRTKVRTSFTSMLSITL